MSPSNRYISGMVIFLLSVPQENEQSAQLFPFQGSVLYPKLQGFGLLFLEKACTTSP